MFSIEGATVMLYFRGLLKLLGLILLWALVWRRGGVDKTHQRLERWAKAHYRPCLWGIGLLFFSLALLEKLSQYYCLQLNAYDFWLFEDMLEQGIEGGYFLTRFASHAVGFVQHGTVHPMLTWALMTGPALLLGPLTACLLFNPLFLSLAGVLLAVLTLEAWGSFGSLAFMVAFYASVQVGKILAYDVHPEAAYPFFLLLWLWWLQKRGVTRGPGGLVLWLALTLGMGIKEDAFLVFGPWVLYFLFLHRRPTPQQQQGLGTMLGCGLVVGGITLLQVIMVRGWVRGDWGPSVWQHQPVVVTASLSQFQGVHWKSAQDVGEILRQLAATAGGGWGVAQKWGHFWVSRPWWSLLIFAPWVLLLPQFWWTLGPLSLIVSLLEGPQNLWNYYAAPFIGSFWYCAASAGVGSRWPRRSPWMIFWLLITSLMLGQSSLQVAIPSRELLAQRRQVQALLPCLQGRHGLVAPQWIALVPRDEIVTARKLNTAQDWQKVDYLLVSLRTSRLELSVEDARAMIARIEPDPDWSPVDSHCQPISRLAEGEVVLWLHTRVNSPPT